MRRHQRSPYGEQHRFYHAGEARPIRAPARRSPRVQNLRGPSSQHAEDGAGGFAPAAPRVRAALAPKAARAPAAHPADAPHRRLCPGLLPRQAQKEDSGRDRARPRRIPARVFPAASPEPAQPALDEEERLVRARSAAATAAKAQSRPYDISSSEMKLIGSLASPYTRKVRIVLAEKKIDYDFEVDNPWKADAQAAKLNPLGKVPVLLLDDGRTLFDSRVIVGFLDNASPIARLVPAENRERVEVRRWEALADGVLDAGVLARLENQREAKLRSAPWIERQMGKVRSGLAAMDSELGDKLWCVGNGYTLADIALGVCLGWRDFRYPNMDWGKEHAHRRR